VPAPTLIVFDLGGVVVRIARSFAEACALAGLPVRAGADDPAMSARRHTLAELHGVGQLAINEFCVEVARTTGGLYSPGEIRRIHDAWLIAEYPGVADVIAALARAGVRTGVLSNTNHAHWVRLAPRRLGGTGEFPAIDPVDHPHASHLLGLHKPDPAIYSAFERETGLAGPDVLFFDDLEENVAAASGLGWRTCRVDHAADPASQIRGELVRLGVLGG
jgi:glucose-1-phosphatase